ncbi:peptide deformylase [Vagococcus entomophilus]|uniref:Peptide deformylase n=1 Tax=Vagococcus entomophilus TaxID=1160095 RepID=A0A430AFN1_9ENTE|nr:peptide deformylase [Vagococcus entomophilus]RSU06550.1 peptide deformylase [Vagococcus entomophilus]
MITMKDIIREGNPTLRKVAEDVPFPLSDEDRKLAEEMQTFLTNSQDPVLAEKYGLRGGVGLAAPQLDVSKRIIALLVPSMDPKNPEPTLDTVMFNPKVISHSVQEACLADGEGCLSVDRDVPGYVVRHNKITVTYEDAQGNKQKKRFKGYEAIVVQHEIDHTNGIMFYDHINTKAPLTLKEGVLVIE